MQEALASELLAAAFGRYGLLVVNEHPDLPSVIGAEGDWQALMGLLEARQVFYSKICKNRVTYLNKELYFHLKPFRQKKIFTETERRIYDFLDEAGEAEKDEIISVLMLSKASCNAAMDELTKSLDVTATRPGRTLNSTWSTLVWGTSRRWEEGLLEEPNSYSKEESVHYIRERLKGILSEKQIAQILKPE
ncbi:AlkZ-related protein [Paenibacillus sp. BAC0078]